MRLDNNYLDVPDPVTLGLAEAGLDTDEVEIVTDEMPPVRDRAPKPSGAAPRSAARWAVYGSPSQEVTHEVGQSQPTVSAYAEVETLRPSIVRSSLPEERSSSGVAEYLLLVMGLTAGGLALFVAAHGP